MDLGMNDTLNWGYMHCMIAASREMSDEPEKTPVMSLKFNSSRYNALNVRCLNGNVTSDEFLRNFFLIN